MEEPSTAKCCLLVVQKKNTASAESNGQTEISMKVTTETEQKRASAGTYGPMAKFTLEAGSTENKAALESGFLKMERSKLGCLKMASMLMKVSEYKRYVY